MKLEAGMMLHDLQNGEHLLLLRHSTAMDDNYIDKDVWWFHIMELGHDAWDWEMVLEDDVAFEVVA